jgi:hypothetical protein
MKNSGIEFRRIRETRLGSFWGIIMRKLALMVAAALIVSAPMLTTGTTDSFAAAKAKAKAEPKAPNNRGLFDALGDNMAGKSVEAKKAKSGKGKGGMRGKAKKGGMGGMGGGMGGMGGKKK